MLTTTSVAKQSYRLCADGTEGIQIPGPATNRMAANATKPELTAQVRKHPSVLFDVTCQPGGLTLTNTKRSQ